MSRSLPPGRGPAPARARLRLSSAPRGAQTGALWARRPDRSGRSAFSPRPPPRAGPPGSRRRQRRAPRSRGPQVLRAAGRSRRRLRLSPAGLHPTAFVCAARPQPRPSSRGRPPRGSRGLMPLQQGTPRSRAAARRRLCRPAGSAGRGPGAPGAGGARAAPRAAVGKCAGRRRRRGQDQPGGELHHQRLPHRVHPHRLPDNSVSGAAGAGRWRPLGTQGRREGVLSRARGAEGEEGRAGRARAGRVGFLRGAVASGRPLLAPLLAFDRKADAQVPLACGPRVGLFQSAASSGGRSTFKSRGEQGQEWI